MAGREQFEDAKANNRSTNNRSTYRKMVNGGWHYLDAAGQWVSDRGNNAANLAGRGFDAVGGNYVAGKVADGWKYVGGEHAYTQTASAVMSVYNNRTYWVILCSVAFVGLFPLMYYLVAPMMPKVGGLSQMMMAVVLQTTVFAVVILAMLGTLGPAGVGKAFGF